jgi:hypothetical protein
VLPLRPGAIVPPAVHRSPAPTRRAAIGTRHPPLR